MPLPHLSSQAEMSAQGNVLTRSSGRSPRGFRHPAAGGPFDAEVAASHRSAGIYGTVGARLMKKVCFWDGYTPGCRICRLLMRSGAAGNEQYATE